MDAATSLDSESATALAGIGGLVLAVTDVDAARDFYCRVLGCAVSDGELPNAGTHSLARTASGGLLAFSGVDSLPDVADSGVHYAFSASPAGRDAIAACLRAEGIAVHGYREDREAEQGDRCYFLDPFGNRIQIVARPGLAGKGVVGIDHAAVQVPDMMWGEDFYGNVLALPVEGRFGLRTGDHARARLWAKGEDDMAPGTRRNDKLYMMMGGQREVPRTNMQIYFAAGDGVIGVYLATRHVQEPPEEAVWGIPRIVLTAPREDLDRVAARLSAARRPFAGPVVHPAESPLAASLYCRDSGGNFIEIAAPRGR